MLTTKLKRGILPLKYPIEHSLAINRDDMEKKRHKYYSGLLYGSHEVPGAAHGAPDEQMLVTLNTLAVCGV